MTGLRIAVATAGTGALLALQRTGLLPASLVVLVSIVFLLGCWAAPRLQRAAGSGLRFAAGFGVAALIMAAALQASGVRDGRGLLAVAAVAVMATTAAEHTTRRALLFGLALAVAVLALAVALAPGPALLLPVLLVWVAAVVSLLLAQRCAESDPAGSISPAVRTDAAPAAALVPAAGARSRGARWRAPARWAAVPVLGCLLAGLAAAATLPRLPQGPSRSGPTSGPGATTSPDGDEVASVPAPARTARAYTSGVLDLRSRGELSDQRVYDVPGGSPTLWRGAVLDRYDGTSWRGRERSPVVLGRPGRLELRPGTDDAVPAGTPVRTDSVRMTPAADGLLVAPGVVRQVDVPAALLLGETGQFTLGSGAAAAAYTVGSMPPDSAADPADAAALRSVTGPDPLDPRWTQLPATLPDRVRDLGRRLGGGTGSRYDAVLAVQRHLRAEASYRLDSPVPAPGRDAVEDFLFSSRSGFCEQFASAEVVLLRSAGIPARLATGFSGGEQADGGRRALRAADAHAWVEVWFPERGWVSSDPTAGSRLDIGWQQRVRQGVADLAGDARGRTMLALLALAVLVLLAGAVLLLARWLRGGAAALGVSMPARAGRGVPPGLLAAFERLEAALHAAGWPRAEHESLADLARRWPDDAGVRAALLTLERAVYGPVPVAPADARAAAAALDRLAGTLPAPTPAGRH